MSNNDNKTLDSLDSLVSEKLALAKQALLEAQELLLSRVSSSEEAGNNYLANVCEDEFVKLVQTLLLLGHLINSIDNKLAYVPLAIRNASKG